MFRMLPISFGTPGYQLEADVQPFFSNATEISSGTSSGTNGIPYERPKSLRLAWLAALVEELGVPRFAAFGVRKADVVRVVEQARRASSMQGNPIALTDDELGEVLRGSV